MADDQTSQQTRVLLVNGQTIILQGDAGDNSINEINADLLQQALQEVSTATEDTVEESNDDYSTPIPEAEDANDNLVAIFQGDQGETHTIQLTVEQAEALGLHFSVDGDDKPIHHDIPEHSAENNMYISDEPDSQLVYSDDTKHNQNEVMFDNELDTNASCTDMVQSRSMANNEQVLQSEEGMGVLSSTVDSLIGEQNQPITLIPQFVDGQMTYTVKLQDDNDEGNFLNNRQFTNIDSDLKSGNPTVTVQQTNVGVTLNNINSFTTTPMPSVSCASTSASISSVQSVPLSVSAMQQSVPLPISSVQQSVPLPLSTVQQPATLPMSPVNQPVSCVQQTLSLNNYQCSRTSGSTISTDKQTKVSYVILPGSNTSTNSSVTTKLSNTPLGRLSSSFVSSSRTQSLVNSNNLISSALKSTTVPMVLATTNSGNSSQVVPGSNSNLTGVPIASSNTNISSTTSLLVPNASATSGMIRVMAGSTTNRTVQPILSSNNSKYNSLLGTPSGRLIATTGNATVPPKIVSINPTSVNKAPTAATPEVTNMVSAALTRMPVPNFNSTKPLGSSENPIQLVQHGQTFHSVQSLTQEQLRQIATVLQQQHLESAPRTKNVVYDAETNTRIIYRVVYPEDLDLRDPRSPDGKGTGLNAGLNSGTSRGRGRRGRPPKSNLRGGLGRGIDGNPGRRVGVNAGSVDMDFDEDRLILDDTTKGERKKQLARTRSGRLSRPPRHMVKDYKRLHHLDFADADLDDSDGGYSDYQMSEHETEETPEKTDNNKELLPGLAVPKRKISSHFRCPTCQKIYLGYSRMSRHFEMYPDHGNIEQLQMPNRSSSNNNNNDDDQAPAGSDPNEAKVGMAVTNSGLNGIVRTGPSRRRGKRRGPWAYTTPEARSQRRKGKLREVLAACEANELAEVAGPAVAGVLSLWDLLLLRVEAVRTEESYVVTLCDEIQALLEKVRAVASEIFKPLDVKVDTKEHQMELQDELLCTTLGVACGTYLVDDNKFHHICGTREPLDDPEIKRMRMGTQEYEDGENEVTKRESAVTINRDVIKECSIESGSTCSRDNAKKTFKKDSDCPEVLSALTLVAKSTIGHLSEQDSSLIPARTSGDDDGPKVVREVTKSDDFLLSGESNDMCMKLTSGSDGITGSRLQQSDHPSEFSNSEQHTQDLQTVDDIVNERLKNLTSGNSLVDFSVTTPMNVVSSCMTTSAIDIPKPSIVSSQDLIDRLGQFRSLRLPNDITSSAVSSFDPEMALAAMGEGEQDSVNTSSQHFPSTLQQMETVPSDSGSSFDPEVALAAMGEGEQTSAEQSQFRQIENVSSSSAFTPEDALVAMGEGEQNVTERAHRQFQNSLPQIGSITNSQRPTFDPEMALAAMGEGEQVTNGGPTEAHFPSTLPSIRIDDISGNNGAPFDPEVALAAIGEGDRSSVSDFSRRNASGNAGRPFGSGISLDEIDDGGTRKSNSRCTENVTDVSRFDPEIALAAMGEGQSITARDSTHIPYQSPITRSDASNEPGSSFDTEMTLVNMGESEAVQTSASSQRSHTSVPIVNTGTFQLQCAPDLGLADTSMDVSLDESGPELDFEALSEEFSRNTRHR